MVRRLFAIVAAIALAGSARPAFAGIAIDVTKFRDLPSASTTMTTPAFSTAAANELLLAFISTDYRSGANVTVTSVTGAGLTWALVVRTNAQRGTSEIWRAFAPSRLTNVTVIAKTSQSVVSSLTVVTFTGVDPSGANGSGAIGAIASANAASGAPAATLVTTRNNSWVFGVGNDYDNATARTLGAAQTLVHQYLPSINDAYWVQRQTAATPAAGTSVTINDTAPTGDRFNLSICEILPAPSAPSWNLSGTITPAADGGGATVTLAGAQLSAVANASGDYTITGVPNGTYTVTAAKNGYAFSPQNQSATVLDANVSGINFTAQSVPTFSLSGTISPASAGGGASVMLSGPASATVVADTSGNYVFNTVMDGAYTVTPQKTGYAFNPISRPATVVGAPVSGIDFATQSLTGSISGAISPALGGSGATISVVGTIAQATADSAGNYIVNNVPNGSQRVVPSKPGYLFTPTEQTVPVNGAAVTGIDFTAQVDSTPTPIRLVQKGVNGSESSVSTISASFPSSNTAGNFLIVTGTAARPAGTITISDTAGNVYLPAIGPVTDGPQAVTAYIWYVPNCRGGANTVTLEPTSARAMEIHVSEWSGISPTSPVDQTAVASGFGTSASSGLRTPLASGELIFGYTFIGNNATVGAGFTPLTLVNGDLDEYVIQTSPAPIAATFTQSSGDWFVLMATFRPNVSDTTAPVVSMSAPANDAAVFGSITVSANASDNVGVSGVQFQLDGANLGSEVTGAPYSISWNTGITTDGPHTLVAVARDAAGNRTTSPGISVSVTNTSNPTVAGAWSAPFDIGTVAVNMVLMHTGKVLMFSGTFGYSSVERVWDPVTGGITLVPNPYYNLFCAGHSQLADGRILVVGGYDAATLGAANANIFDPITQNWTPLPNMAYRRWYPTSTTLPDGRALVMSGAQTCLTCLADVPEIFDPATNKFTTMPTARLGVPYYPFMFVMADGTVLDAGANESAAPTRKLDVAARTWTTVDPIVTDGHSAAMYLPGKIVKTGTAADSGTPGAAARTAYVLDMTQPTPAWRQVASMANPRAFHNSTILPDGTVLITGGGTMLDGYDVSKSVFAAELWTPATETWRTLSSAAVPRLYHSTALLLPDARVLTAGSGSDGPAINQTRAEIFSPPYLFKGARPSIASAPDLIQYGAAFAVETPDAASIASVSLVRPGAVTHAFDEDQRFLNLAFTAGAGTLSIQAPANANLAPPGYYMLFILNTAGVPSVASFVHFDAPTVDTEVPSTPLGVSGQGAIGSASLTWTASTDNTGVAVYNVHHSTTSGFVPSAANRIGQPTSTAFTHNGATAGSHYYVVTAQDVAGNVSLPSAEASVLVLADTTAPTVAITAPVDHATVTGSIAVTATASDDVGVAGVQFKLDGQVLGAERTAAPYSISWNSATTSNGTHTLTAVARDAAGHLTPASVDVVVSNTTQTPTGLVAAFSFNEGVGLQTTDASGQGNTGTISSATWTAAGKFGSALSFNGTSAWVTVADAASLDLTNGMTLEAWVNPSAGTGWRTVMLKENASTMSYSLYSANNASRPAGFVHTTVDVALNGTAAVALNAWTHLAVTFDGATMRMFVNGVQVSTRALAGAAAVGAGALRIGGNSVWGEYFKGLIDEVRVYNRALTAAEIQTDMNIAIP